MESSIRIEASQNSVRGVSLSVDFISTVWSTVASRFCSISLSAVSLLVAARTFFRNYGIKDEKWTSHLSYRNVPGK